MAFGRLLQMRLRQGQSDLETEADDGQLRVSVYADGVGEQGRSIIITAVFVVYDYHRRRGTRSAVRSKNFDHVAGVYSCE